MPTAGAVIHGIIDVGSNAIRMYVAAIDHDGVEILSKHRAALRLGAWVFEHGSISAELQDAVLEVMAGFGTEFTALGVEQVTAIATSATREASNHVELTARIQRECGFELSVISGQAEADLVAATMSARLGRSPGRSLWLDLGGGSVEVVVEAGDTPARGASFRLGALRLLHQLPGSQPHHGAGFVAALRDQVMRQAPAIRRLIDGPVQRFAAAGGSLETMERLLRNRGESHDCGDGVWRLDLERISHWQAELAQHSCQQRIEQFDLRPDRADTIIPAAVVTTCIGEIAGIHQVLIPRVDLRDGLVERLRQQS